MYPVLFWCEFIDLVVFFLVIIVWPLSLSSLYEVNFTSYYEESDRGQTIVTKKTTKSMNSHQKTQKYIKGKSPLFILNHY